MDPVGRGARDISTTSAMARPAENSLGDALGESGAGGREATDPTITAASNAANARKAFTGAFVSR
jgi:hypothetical protein